MKPCHTKTYTVESLSDLVRDEIVPFLDKRNILTLQGPLGAGKTTLVQELLAQCGVKNEYVTSPTFSYVNRYESGGRVVYHFDLYRIESQQEFCELGFDDILAERDALIIIEWPQVIIELLASEKLANKVLSCIIAYCFDDLQKRDIKIFV